MIDHHADPPRWAHALLRTVLRPADVDAVPGDLIEEYRERRHPSLGAYRADLWYVTQVLSIVSRVVWPFVLAAVALRLLTFPLPRGWNPSLVRAPGVSMLDAAIFVWAGFVGARRSGRVITGLVTASVTSLVTLPMFFIYAAIQNPTLLRAPFEKPFIAVIVATLFAVAVGFAAALGTLGATAGRLLDLPRRRAGAR